MDDELIHDDTGEISESGEEAAPVAPQDGLGMVMIIFTTIFLLIGMGLMFWELSEVYSIMDPSNVKATSKK